MAWLQRHLGKACISDMTRETAVLGLMGPNAPNVWRAAGGFAEALALPFGSGASGDVASIPVRAVRISYIGEYGWELYVPWDVAGTFAQRLMEAGARYDLRPMGLQAVDSCRMEKAFRHWGHDIGPDDTPLDAGLGFAVGWEKPHDFIGRAALERQRADGSRRQLVQFAVEGAHPLLLHDEPVFRDGKLAGRTTSGARGFRTGLSLGFAYIPMEAGETKSEVAESRFEVSVAGRRYPLRVLAKPPYDPEGLRMRAKKDDKA